MLLGFIERTAGLSLQGPAQEAAWDHQCIDRQEGAAREECANLKAGEIARSGRIGKPRVLNAVFANEVTDEDNIRLNPFAQGGGTLYDIGIYCLNAARAIFRSEPIEVMAFSEAPSAFATSTR